MSTTKYRVSADIGGTFTDIVVEPSDGPAFLGKVPTTPDDPATGVVNGIQSLIPDLRDVDFFVHGTTVGLNAFLERRGERVLLLTTEGLGDAYTIARGGRHTLYELRYQKPELLVPPRDVHEVGGRLAWDGTELAPLERSDFDPIIEKVEREGIRAVAVCFVHAYAYPKHEVQAREWLTEALPGVSVSLSHEIAREWREYERASSAVMNAYIAPVVERYLASLRSQLSELGMHSTVHIMQSNGGVSTAETAAKRPVFSLLSGPVGGTIAGTALAASGTRKNLLCVDMGGTSFDLSLVIEGEASATLETELEGLPLLMSIVDIQTIGTGGGSIAWLENGAMRVGPHSAGSQPGPACYGRGGTQPTVTDANLFLGRLGQQSLLGGDMSLDMQAAAAAIESLAGEAGVDPVAFAEGILSISNAAMADAMRTITVSQGLDPRDFALVAFGGAGPMAAAFLAEELDIDEIVVPKFPGTFSAWGMLQTDLRHDFTQSFFKPAQAASPEQIDAAFKGLESDGQQAIAAEGVMDDRISFQRSADMRYTGQEYTINVLIDSTDIEELITRFHSAYRRRYGHSSPEAPVEFVNLRVAALGHLERHSISESEPNDTDPRLGEREMIFNGRQVSAPVYARDRLPLNFDGVGPAVVEEQSATTIIPPGWRISVDASDGLILTKERS